MEQETLFTASKWEILKLLERGPASPIELASLSRTSVANVSQQLRLLEMAGLVKSERVPNRDKGQPRILYSIAGNSCYMISTASDFVNKKLHAMTDFNKIILKIWFHPNDQLHYFIEKGFWQIDQLVPKLQALGVTNGPEGITFHLQTSQKLGDLNPITFTNFEGFSTTINYEVVDSLPDGAYSLYDQQNQHRGGRE